MDYLSKNVAANLKRIRKSKCMSLDQAAEEINVPLKKIGKMMILSVVFYSFVILAVGYVLNPEEIALSQSTTGLVTADAMAKAFWNLGDGKSYHRRWYVRYCYILELLYLQNSIQSTKHRSMH